MSDALPAVVLDTNVLHDLRLYLAFAHGTERYPYHEVRWTQTQGRLPSDVEEKRLQRALRRGGRVLYFLKEEDAELFRCSPVELELLRRDALSRAQDKAMRTSLVDGRWWTYLADTDVNWWLTAPDRQSVVMELEQTFATLEGLGIRVSGLDKGDAFDVVQLARQIMTVVYMGTLDCIVYAHALVAGATHLLTSDEAFGNLIRRFRDPKTPEILDSELLSSLVEAATSTPLAYTEFPQNPPLSELAA